MPAVVAADYKFIYVDVGKNGRVSDGGIFANSLIYHSQGENNLIIPLARGLTKDEIGIPYALIGDTAFFEIIPNLMQPYQNLDLDDTRKIFNLTSRAHRVFENVFGILTSRFGIYQKLISLAIEKAEKIILATFVLHNFLRSKISFQKLRIT